MTKHNTKLQQVLHFVVDILKYQAINVLGRDAIDILIGTAVSKAVNETLDEVGEGGIVKRAEEASSHLAEAAQILDTLQKELNKRNEELASVINTISSHRQEAEHWKTIASVNEQLAYELTSEIERRVKEQIHAELERGKTTRRIFSVFLWFVTLAAGAIAGAVVSQWWQTGRIFLKP